MQPIGETISSLQIPSSLSALHLANPTENDNIWTFHHSQSPTGTRVGVDYKSPITITITITVPIKLSITITVVIEKAITITITIIRLRLQLLVYHGNDSRLFIPHVHLQYYHA